MVTRHSAIRLSWGIRHGGFLRICIGLVSVPSQTSLSPWGSDPSVKIHQVLDLSIVGAA